MFRPSCLLSIGVVLCVMLFSVMAYASCDDLNSNETWNSKFQEITVAYKAGEYQKVIDIAQSMESICSDSPIYNYYIAKSYTALGEHRKALRFYQKATDNLSRFTTTDEVTKELWYGRYEAEFPELTQKNIEDLKARIEDQNNQIEQCNSRQTQTAITQVSDTADRKRAASVTMWTGAAMGIAGVALVGVGTGFLIARKDPKIDYQSGSDGGVGHWQLKNDEMYIGGIAMLAAGCSLTLAGTIMTAVGGYQYTHIELNEDVSLAFDFGTLGASMQITF